MDPGFEDTNMVPELTTPSQLGDADDIMFLLNTGLIAEPLPGPQTPTTTAAAATSAAAPVAPSFSNPMTPAAPAMTGMHSAAADARKAKGRGRGRGRGSKAANEKEKRAKRLARNRESARQSRLRKKQHLELLEEKVAQLTSELDELARQHLARAEASLATNMRSLLESLQELTRQPPSSELNDRMRHAVKALQEKFGPDCQERRSVRDFHFEQLQRLLLPPHTKLMLYLIGQNDQFFDHPRGRDTHGVWSQLCHDIGLTPEQEDWLKAALRKERDTPKHVHDTKTLGTAVDFVQRFRQTMFDRAGDLQRQMNAMHNVLTPAQSLRYMLWVENNRDRLQTGLCGPSGGKQTHAMTGGVPPPTLPPQSAAAAAVVTARSAAAAAGAGGGAAAGSGAAAAGGNGGGASVAALIGAARGTAAATRATGSNVRMLDQARLEDVLLQKPDKDLTMADMSVLVHKSSAPRDGSASS